MDALFCCIFNSHAESVGSVLDISLLSLKDGDSNGQLQAIILSRNDKGCNSVMQFQVDNSILEQSTCYINTLSHKALNCDCREPRTLC